jgi:hypothetical protein
MPSSADSFVTDRCRQHHDRAEVDLAAEETYRRRRASSATALHRAAEASTGNVLRAELVTTGRPARVVRDVEPPAAERTPCGLRLGREVVVDPRQQQQDPGVEQRFVAQVGPPSDLPVERRGTPR